MNFFNGSCGNGFNNGCNGGCDCCSMIVWILLLQCLCGCGNNNNGCGMDCCTLITLLLLCGCCGNSCCK